MAKKYTIVISDEEHLTNGRKVIVSGIRLEGYKKNPVVFWQHSDVDRWEREDYNKPPIGRCENLRIEGSRLIGDFIFDTSDPQGKIIEEKFAKGFLHAVSVFLEVNKRTIFEDDPARPTEINESTLRSLSAVNVPGNEGSVIVASIEQVQPNPNAILGDTAQTQEVIIAKKTVPVTHTQTPEKMNTWDKVVAFLAKKASEITGEDLIGLKDSVQKLQASLETAQKEAADRKTQIENLTASLETEKKKVGELTASLETSQKKTEELTASLTQKTKEFDDYAKAHPTTHSSPQPAALTEEEAKDANVLIAMKQAIPDWQDKLKEYQQKYGGK